MYGVASATSDPWGWLAWGQSHTHTGQEAQEGDGGGRSEDLGGSPRRLSHFLTPIRDLAMAGRYEARALALVARNRVAKATSGRQILLLSLL